MSTVNTTKSTNQYDPTSMGTYNSFQSTIASGLSDFAKNPLQATYFNNQLGMSNRANQNWENTANQAFFANQRTLGQLNNPGAFAASQLAKNQRAGLARQSNTFNNLLLNAQQVRMAALGQMQGYRPLQTGQTQTQSQSGLGTWLPQLVGAGISAATGGMTGGFGGFKPPTPGIGPGNPLLNFGPSANTGSWQDAAPTYLPQIPNGNLLLGTFPSGGPS